MRAAAAQGSPSLSTELSPLPEGVLKPQLLDDSRRQTLLSPSGLSHIWNRLEEITERDMVENRC